MRVGREGGRGGKGDSSETSILPLSAFRFVCSICCMQKVHDREGGREGGREG